MLSPGQIQAGLSGSGEWSKLIVRIEEVAPETPRLPYVPLDARPVAHAVASQVPCPHSALIFLGAWHTLDISL